MIEFDTAVQVVVNQLADLGLNHIVWICVN